MAPSLTIVSARRGYRVVEDTRPPVILHETTAAAWEAAERYGLRSYARGDTVGELRVVDGCLGQIVEWEQPQRVEIDLEPVTYLRAVVGERTFDVEVEGWPRPIEAIRAFARAAARLLNDENNKREGA